MNRNFLEFTRVLQLETQALSECVARYLNHAQSAITIDQTIEFIFDRTQRGGKIIVLGIGKSGKIAAKIAATFSSTGTPAVFVHPTEALHGDLGVVTEHDVAFAISYTGNTEELMTLIPYFTARGIPLIGVGGNKESQLGQKCQFWIDAHVSEEACSHNLAPTSSTTLTLALGDAIAMALMKRKGFSANDFAKNHPGGSLGRRLQLQVKDMMHSLDHCPVVTGSATIETVLNLATEKKLGAVLVVEAKRLVGVITDGDIRRALKHKNRFFEFSAADIMTQKPITIIETLLAYDALRLMEERESQISVLPVVNTAGEIAGLLRIHDLVQTL